MADFSFRHQTPSTPPATELSPAIGGVVDSGTTTTTTTSTSRDLSPADSVVIFTPESSNFSRFSSSVSPSVDRCSFASDALDRDSLSSSAAFDADDFSQHLAGREGRGRGGKGDSLRGPDPSLPHSNKKLLMYSANVTYDSRRGKAEKTSKVEQEEDYKILGVDDDDVNDEGVLALDSARNSFSQAVKDCQERRIRSEALTNQLERRRPASLDLNSSVSNSVSSSPRFSAMKKVPAISSRKPGNLPSPRAPKCGQGSVGTNKGWSSEGVPLQTGTSNRRQVGGTAQLPFVNKGRALPSKWEDAERWIFSPVSGDGTTRTSCKQQPSRKPKSKSGPLGPPGTAYYSLFSPTMPMYEGNSFISSSKISAGLLSADELTAKGREQDPDFSNSSSELCITRSASVHGCKNMSCQSSANGSRDDSHKKVKGAVNKVGQNAPRLDVATHMSPAGSPHLSPRRSSFSLSTSSFLPIEEEVRNCNSSKSEVRDVQVDERVTVTRWSKKHRSRIHGNGLNNVDGWKSKDIEANSSTYEVSDSTKTLTWAIREESRISAWENLQKAKADAAIRKLEIKLEKKRSSSMDKIMKKLKSAQMKAEEMRNSISVHPTEHLSKSPPNKHFSFLGNWRMGSLQRCFSCRAS